MSRKTDFIIVGAPKCGTTALYSYLKQHPDVFMPEPKELHYFGQDLKTDTNWRTAGWYQERFKGATPLQLRGEASPSYIFSDMAAKEIRDYNKDVKIIIMVRKPATLLYSLYYQRVFSGYECAPTFEDALFNRTSELDGFRSAAEKRIGVKLPDYLVIPRFADHIQRYRACFPESQLKIIVYEDFKHDTGGEYEGVLKFLGLRSVPRETFAVVNGNKKVRSRLLKTIADNPTVKKTLQAVVPAKMLKRLNRMNTNYFERPPMQEATRARLNEIFVDQVARLEVMLDRRLDWQ